MDRPLGVAGKSIIRRDGKILLIRRAAISTHDPGLWELPGGKLEYGEELVKAVEREVSEETGLAVAVGQPIKIWHFSKQPFWVTGVTFVCDYAGGAVCLSSEHDTYAWIDPAEYVNYPLSTSMKEQIEAYLQCRG
ncbi:MAG: NUDIX domain-containing protein [Acidobacteria bacterium]|nr:NUDIX domain-containing protein [Acidobacteriota bacterium]